MKMNICKEILKDNLYKEETQRQLMFLGSKRMEMCQGGEDQVCQILPVGQIRCRLITDNWILGRLLVISVRTILWSGRDESTVGVGSRKNQGGK